MPSRQPISHLLQVTIATAIVLLHDLITGACLPAMTVARLTRKLPFPSLTGDGRCEDLVRALRAILGAGALEPGEEAVIRFGLGLVLETMHDHDASHAELGRAIPHLSGDPADAAWAMTILGYPRGTTSPASTHLRWLRRAERLTAPMAAAERLRFTWTGRPHCCCWARRRAGVRRQASPPTRPPRKRDGRSPAAT